MVQVHPRVEDDELEELEAVDRLAHEPAESVTAVEHEWISVAEVDDDRDVGAEDLVELVPRPARCDVGVRVLQSVHRDVIDRLARHVHVAHPRSRRLRSSWLTTPCMWSNTAPTIRPHQ